MNRSNWGAPIFEVRHPQGRQFFANLRSSEPREGQNTQNAAPRRFRGQYAVRTTKRSVRRVTLGCMEVAEHDVARIPVDNIRVSREDFAAVWGAAELRCAELGEQGVTDDWYAAGVAVTCAWIATATVRPVSGRSFAARSPATRTTAVAYEELIEAEYLAAEQLDVRRPDLLASRPGWCEGIRATLRWAWRYSGPAPLPISSPQVTG